MSGKSKVGLVEKLFHGTGDSYGRIVHLTTFGQDNVWKERLLRRMDHPKKVLDLACGTGIFTFAMRKRWPDCHVTGVELRDEYLKEARARATEEGDAQVRFILSDAQKLVLDEQFDAITSCYIPKYVDLDILVGNMIKMLAPGGLLLLQDFAYPRRADAQDQWERHFSRLLEDAKVSFPDYVTMFTELPAVIRESRWIEETVANMEKGGLVDIEVEELTFGTAATVLGRKPPLTLS